jgi:hypothetical protein
MADIGAVRVIFGADIAELQDGIKKATDALGSFGKAAGAIAAGTGLERAVERTFDKIVESIEKAIDSADKLAKASQKFGIPSDSLQVLAQSAALSDVSLESLTSSVAKLSKNMIAAEGPTSDQAAAFKALGLNIGDLIKLRPDEAFLKVADAISKYADGTTKTAAVQAIFGKGAADLIPILNQGSAGFNELKKRMEDTGQIMSGETLAAAEKYKDTLTELSRAKDALIAKILGDSGLLGAMQKLAESFIETAGNSKKFEENFGGLRDLIHNTVEEFQSLLNIINAIKNAPKTAGEIFTDLARGLTQGLQGIGDAAVDLPNVVVDVSSTVEQSAKAFNDSTAAMLKMVEASGLLNNTLTFNPQANKNLEAFTKEMAKLKAETLDAANAADSQFAPGFFKAAQNLEYLKNEIKVADDGTITLGQHAQQLNQAMLALEGRKIITDDNLTLMDQYEQKINAINAALAASKQRSEDVAAAERARGVETLKATDAFLSGISGSLSFIASGFAQAAQKNKEFAGIAKATALAMATVNTAEAFTKALTAAPPPFNFALAALVAAAGAAQIGIIAATQFAKGGSFKVPGGISGVDNQLVPLALSSGERVDITPAGQHRDAGGRGREITLSGIGPRDLFTGSMLRDLVDALNQGQRDGYRLKLAER